MVSPLTICVAIGLLALGANGVVYSYSNQSAWNDLGGSFCNGNRQSPINIVTANVRSNSMLTGLRMNRYWNTATSGSWLNNGHTLKFTPSSSQATTTTFIAEYVLRQFHFHWGPNANVGSENKVNNRFYSGELHFVHQNTSEVAAGSQFTVVAVFFQSNDSMNITGIWERLNRRPAYNQSVTISDIVFNQLLPDNLDYYYFPGSLTTPLCNEIVEWFVLKTPISVPAQFFAGLRMVQDSQGERLTLNYREVQPLNDRTVSEYTASSGFTPALTFALLILSVVAATINF